MKRLLCILVSGAFTLSSGVAVADSHEGDTEEANVASPMEMYACSYNEGQGHADLDAATEKFNAWADKQGIEDYSAWTLVPFYSGPEQEFDVLWFGGSDKAKALGRVQDIWLATGSEQSAAFAAVMTCDAHAAYSVLMTKQPPEREDDANFIATFSDCNIAEGTTFDDLYMPLTEWGEYKAENGSAAGHWVFFPSFGGGKEDFDFKWVTTAASFESLGADWDQMNESGWQKVNELFRGKLSCDSSRAYVATQRRMAVDDE
ncbi:MAG: hypothetical protein KJP17_10470 [Gammaproteobacteria bacterium]|nr:hypothetical protein [Gammaproteobacteria bacterium]